jgi:hypothetical protein
MKIKYILILLLTTITSFECNGNEGGVGIRKR